MLSAVSQQIQMIQEALKEHGRQIEGRDSCAILIIAHHPFFL